VLTLRGEVDPFADHNKLSNAVTPDYRASLFLH